MRSVAGLGVNVTEVYSWARVYLKGFFNAIEAWRGDRDLDGWRLGTVMDELAELEAIDAPGVEFSKGYPIATRITDQLLAHVKALLKLFESDVPLTVSLRPTDAHKLRYMVMDAAAEGFSNVVQFPELRLNASDGLWDEGFAEGGSNLREAMCFGNKALLDVRSGVHDGCALWAATDNAVWSHVWSNGMSSAIHLFDLVLELKVECQKHEVFIHCFHISGNRMIATGVDGRSRGNLDSGVSLGYDIRQFLPLNKGAFEVAGPKVEAWCKGWMGEDFSSPLTPGQWFWEGHKPGVHVWAPPPAAALVSLKQLARSRQKGPHSVTHVFLCPRLLWQEEWRRRFEKEMDIWFFLNPGTYWPHSLFEPLVVGISFAM